MYVKCPMPDHGYARGSSLGHMEKLYVDAAKRDAEKIKHLEEALAKANVPKIDHPEGERTLKECETIIESGMSAHVESWFALKEIHDRKLYAPKYENFKEYCLGRWGYRAEGYRYLEAANVSQLLRHANLSMPPTSAHARQLVPLLKEPDKLREAWSLAMELEHPTFLDVKDIVDGFLPKKPEIHEGESGRESGRGEGGAEEAAAWSLRGIATEAAANPVSPHLSVHLSLDAAIEEAFAKAESGDDQIIEDLKWAAYNISRKLKALGYEPFDWTKEEPT